MKTREIQHYVKRAAQVADRFRRGVIPEVVAEFEILALGFASVRHGPGGLEAQHALTWYSLTKENEHG